MSANSPLTKNWVHGDAFAIDEELGYDDEYGDSRIRMTKMTRTTRMTRMTRMRGCEDTLNMAMFGAHVHVRCTWPCSKDMDMLPCTWPTAHVHVQSTWPCSWHMAMFVCSWHMAMFRAHGHVRGTWPCVCWWHMAMFAAHGHVQSAWPCPLNMAMCEFPWSSLKFSLVLDVLCTI